ncbi:hypothetical protein QFC24_006292 [Naganishia onofrii]|uniref:Uncharacterized protein n=1 Tax=Naganishia onofrii TaxID=1851511 RepID=A0ACC2X3Q0_9TREE|nr:hypothetical protein QFC24_006292 [Naganishia onofrii]
MSSSTNASLPVSLPPRRDAGPPLPGLRPLAPAAVRRPTETLPPILQALSDVRGAAEKLAESLGGLLIFRRRNCKPYEDIGTLSKELFQRVPLPNVKVLPTSDEGSVEDKETEDCRRSISGYLEALQRSMAGIKDHLDTGPQAACYKNKNRQLSEHYRLKENVHNCLHALTEAVGKCENLFGIRDYPDEASSSGSQLLPDVASSNNNDSRYRNPKVTDISSSSNRPTSLRTSFGEAASATQDVSEGTASHMTEEQWIEALTQVRAQVQTLHDKLTATLQSYAR